MGGCTRKRMGRGCGNGLRIISTWYIFESSQKPLMGGDYIVCEEGTPAGVGGVLALGTVVDLALLTEDGSLQCYLFICTRNTTNLFNYPTPNGT